VECDGEVFCGGGGFSDGNATGVYPGYRLSPLLKGLLLQLGRPTGLCLPPPSISTVRDRMDLHGPQSSMPMDSSLANQVYLLFSSI
jgi:hypothetical protein